jgi:hypothetical protein
MGAGGAVAALSRFAAADQPEGARRYSFVQIDVFTSHRLQGNPLIVFPDARGLSDAELQDLARETNLQETTFVFPRDRECPGWWQRDRSLRGPGPSLNLVPDRGAQRELDASRRPTVVDVKPAGTDQGEARRAIRRAAVAA